ncbi:hypothetical protein MA16_Dca018043 [Dendrobium catenatum]|uniref:Uncharacterized protein n=1 Tax=Dendrobium catenatum TaxID=906689 RepID=A0A2I0WRG4_9ASPA|nr:hypothetical protein MA16_Dca018043 [Dendrobium catenatum]
MELDVSKKHLSEVWIGFELNGYFQKVEFENLPIFCSHYKMHGHGVNECFRLHPQLHRDKAGSKQSQCNNGPLIENDNFPSVEIEGNNAKLVDAPLPMPIDSTPLHTSPIHIHSDSTIMDAPPIVHVNDIGTLVYRPNDCDNLENQGLTDSLSLNIANSELLVMDCLLNTNKSSNVYVALCNDHD